ncbi:TrgA family protein [Maritimibacter sp. HL-12]|jgi:hypothetical protein|uniref:TrgA family protein n=1 Tax=Maritimibacter sp. HL-12 TaxID=1162418 RepID=UPI000A0F3F7C|nr:TrgA family protein [Maritimibacter sp. HL-12]SMH58214.1 hypothetical protein SAMN05661107_3568 [Maritimibacter sp. HL-12]
MPTMARLVAALMLAALGWFTADLVKPYLPESRPLGLFAPVSAVVGLGVGWIFTGRRLHGGAGSAPGIGLSSVALQVFWVVFIFAGYDMLQRALRKTYDGPMEALVDAFSLMSEHAMLAAQVEVIAVLVLGGLVTGTVVQWVAARWR